MFKKLALILLVIMSILTSAYSKTNKTALHELIELKNKFQRVSANNDKFPDQKKN